MALTIDDLLASPDHYLHAFDGDDAMFVPMDRDAYHRSIFLDQRISPAGDGTMRLPAALLAGQVRRALPTRWIFHIAHCGSTLLARALDHPAANLVLREPLALRQTAIAPAPDRIALVLAMIGKRYAADLPTLVKANVPVNFLLPAIVAHDAAAPAVFLYLGLDDYLAAILRSDDHRGWLRRVTAQLGERIGDFGDSGDGARAAALWSAQIHAFATAIAAMPNARSLDAEHFFAAPGPILAAAARRLGIAIDAATIDAQVAGPLFATYSKNPQLRFDAAARRDRQAAVQASIVDDRRAAHRWIERHGTPAATALATVAAAALD